MRSIATKLEAIRGDLGHIIGAPTYNCTFLLYYKAALLSLLEAMRYGPLQQRAAESRKNTVGLSQTAME